MSGKPPISEACRDEIVAFLEEYSNAAYIAKRLHVSATSVRNIALAEGIPLKDGISNRGRFRNDPEQDKRIALALRLDQNARRVARLLGDVSHEKVRQYAIAHQIPIRRHAKKSATSTNEPR